MNDESYHFSHKQYDLLSLPAEAWLHNHSYMQVSTEQEINLLPVRDYYIPLKTTVAFSFRTNYGSRAISSKYGLQGNLFVTSVSAKDDIWQGPQQLIVWGGPLAKSKDPLSLYIITDCPPACLALVCVSSYVNKLLLQLIHQWRLDTLVLEG